jgi:outer membrane protein TolC
MAAMLLLALVGGGAVLAQETRQLSVEEAVKLAVENNLSLESARVTVGTKKRAADTAWNVFIPTVSIAGSLVRDNVAAKQTVTVPAGLDTVTIPPLDPESPVEGWPAGIYPVMPAPSRTMVYEVSQVHLAGQIQAQLAINFAMFEAMNRLKHDYQGGLIALEKAKAQLERDVRKSYYQMLLLEEQIAMLKESFASAERQVAQAEANYRSGRAPELTLLQARVSMENQKPNIDQAENGRKLAMASFAMNLGLPYDTVFALTPMADDQAFAPLDVQEMITRAAGGKPDILELKQTILTLESARKATMYRNYTPNLVLGWNSVSTIIDPGEDWKDPNLNKSGSFTLSLSFGLNGLLPIGAEANGLKDLDDNIRSLNIGLAQAVRGTEIEVYNTILTLRQAQATIEAQAQTVNLAERSFRMTEEAYRAGLQDLLEVQNAELQLRQARVAVLQQQYNYFSGLIDLEYSIGVPFGTLSGERK